MPASLLQQSRRPGVSTSHPAAPGQDVATSRPVVASPGGSPATEQPRPDPARWSAALAVCAVQATQGLRPPLQLHRWVAAPVYESIRQLAQAAARRQRPESRQLRPHARRVRLTELMPGTMEAAVVISEGNRTRAVAIRLHWRRQHWFATEVTVI